ncbi:carbamoyl-phosphate synthase L chain, ATP binding domain-domain-containing protein [Protomyces lactucae-debilis]|uniref:Carbamoyl-phosphate synthase L chain, ATP binding domain-domain-containing protein n=1 Tax=Protomyces lactucae-debilis TaxID=2754530 RepID=A0A1Y2FFF1_PROLT|nr:carbamoyl-phosphate synthase L chain, ATP binding domain-containing protein [Protomyces lactucae-debilis]ORY82134.1 carbamoyl-phosphate synthase L chain, ATP binding domain-domain-containing protein [Protomyces lactucae-debilis]
MVQAQQPKYVARPLESPSIGRIIIANRAEIASRVVRTCKLLSITSIAIYSKQDARSSYWREADESYYIGDLEKDGNAYINPRKLVEIALEMKADGVHPGYGYLSENAAFANMVEEAGLIWIGPKGETIDILGDKAACKQFLRERAGGRVPLIPGMVSRSQDPEMLRKEASGIGYPVLLKASAGGGGKGMRIVESDADFDSALSMAKSEAKRSFGSDDMLLEKYIAQGKHVEVQMFGDSHGNCRIFGDRECSVQRRHQKVIEEAPAIVSDALKNTMQTAAREIARATNYRGAGTVEFIVDVLDQKAYFLEVNTRIQVEHSITEEVYGIDLVALQIFVATGGALTDIPEMQLQGHAIEMRLYAEDPYENFLPQKGLVTLFRESKIPARYESSVQTGDAVTINFDPMICKVIVWAGDRRQCILKSGQVLGSTVCLGLQTNQAFMIKCMEQAAFRDSSYTTGFIAEHLAALTKRADERTGAIASSVLLRALRPAPREAARLTTNPPELIIGPTKGRYCISKPSSRTATRDNYSLQSWVVQDVEPDTSKALNVEGAKLVQAFYGSMKARHDEQTCHVLVSDLHHAPMQYDPSVRVVSARITLQNKATLYLATVRTTNGVTHVHLDGFGSFQRRSALVGFGELDSRASGVRGATGSGYAAPMPCKIVRIECKNGQAVKAGQGLLVIESMKTEVRILAREDGIATILVKEGDLIEEGIQLADVKKE